METKKITLISGSILLGLTITSVTGISIINRLTQDINASTFVAESRISRDVQPQKASVSIYIERSSSSQAESNQEMEQTLVSLVDYLKEQGYEQSDLTTNSSLYSEPDWYYMDKERPSEKEFTARGEITLTINQLETRQTSLGALFQTLVEKGATSLSPLAYEVDNQEDICKELSLESLSAARSRANEILSAVGGRRITRVQVTNTQTSCDSGVYPIYYRSDMGVSSDVAPREGGVTSAPRTSEATEIWSVTQLEVTYR